MVKEQTELLWAVVKVESGIPVMVEAYWDRQSAKMREQSLRKEMHPENDETGVFEIQIGSAQGTRISTEVIGLKMAKQSAAD